MIFDSPRQNPRWDYRIEKETAAEFFRGALTARQIGPWRKAATDREVHA